MYQQAIVAVLVSANVLTAALDAPGQTVFLETFEDAEAADSRLRWDTRQWRRAGGILRSVDGHLSMCTFDIGGLALTDWRLSFEVKRFLVPDGDQHFGVVFSYADETSLRVYCRGKAVYYWDKSGSKTRAHTKLGSDLTPPLGSGDGAPWTPFVIATEAAYVHVDVGGRRVGAIRREPAELRSAQFYAYHVDCGFDDIHFESLTPAAARDNRAGVPELALYAAFDGTTAIRRGDAQVTARAAEGLTFTEGVLGQAVRVSTADGANLCSSTMPGTPSRARAARSCSGSVRSGTERSGTGSTSPGTASS